jgi:protein TonB
MADMSDAPPPGPRPQAVARRPDATNAPKPAPPPPATRLSPLVITASAHGDPRLPAYPLEARYKGQQGDVLIEVEVDAAGIVHAARVRQSSGHASLDSAAVRSARALRFRPPRAPPGVVLRNAILVEIPFSFRLE